MAEEIFPYRFSYADPGLFLEIYIPTKFEKAIRRILKKGFKIDFVKKYLKEKDHVKEIKDLLEENDTLRAYTSEQVDLLKPILKGYSIYRGKGAYLDDKGKVQPDDVSVVRLMFLPPLKDDFPATIKEARFAARQYLRHWTHDMSKYLEHRDASHPPVTDLERALICGLDKWLNDIDLVVNGYVIHSLCREVLQQVEQGAAKKVEDEIWVGSFRCLAVNKIESIAP